MSGLRARDFATAAAALAAFGGAAAACAEEVPQLISPLQVQADGNGINLVTGRTTIEGPVLAVPGAPNLRFDRIQNAAPYVKAIVATPTGSEIDQRSYAVHTGAGSEAFQCANFECASTGGTGSTFLTSSRTYRQAGSGAVWTFSLLHSQTPSPHQTMMYYASSVAWPNGEVISYSYDSVHPPGDFLGRTFYRPNRIESNRGYFIGLAYQSDDFGSNGWSEIREAAIYASAAPAIPLGRLTYGADGGTITDLGGRVFACQGCSNQMGIDLEVSAGMSQLPGDYAPALQVTALAGAPVAGAASQRGVAWSYAYANLRHEASTLSELYDRVTVTGPLGAHVYEIAQQALPESPYQHRNLITRATDALGRSTDYYYDGYARPVRIVSPERDEVAVVYDQYGNIVSRTRRAKPGSGLADIVETASFPASCSDVLCYRPIWTRDGLGRQTDYAYDGYGQLTERLDPGDANGVRRRTSIAYEAGTLRRPLSVRICADTGASCGTGAPIQTSYEYWGATLLPAVERRIDAAAAAMLETHYGYDAAGRLISTDGPMAGDADTSYNRYDLFGRLAGTIGPDPDGAGALPRLAVRTSFDAADRPVKVETGTLATLQAETVVPADWTGFIVARTLETSYDANGRKVRETLREGSAGAVRALSQYSYDGQGRLECTAVRMNPAAFGAPPASACTPGSQGSDGPDRIARNVYDAAGQRVQLREGVGTADEGTEATWAYDLNGQVTTVIDGNGNRAGLHYDGHGRQDRWTFPSPTRPASFNDSTQATALATAGSTNPADYEEYGYDAVGNRTSLRKRDGTTIGYSYDGLNRLTGRDLPAGAWYNFDRSFGYDVFGRLVSASGNGTIALSWDGFGRMTAETGPFGTVGYAYDAAGRRSRLTWPDGYYVSYDYFDDGALAHIRENGAASGPGVLATFSYDGLGRRTRLDRGNGAATTYAPDALSRLAGLNHAFSGGAGNVAWSYEHNPANGLRSAARDNDGYAWAGHYAVNRAYISNGRNQYTAAGATGFGYDANGNLTSDGARGFEYDAGNRLTVGYVGAAHQELIDDPRDRLFRYYDGTANRWLIYDGTDLIAEVDGNGTTLRRYVHGPGEDDPLVWYEGAGTSDRRWLHADAQGSIVALSDANGALLSINRYDEYGIPAATNTGRFQYTGQAWLAEVGIYYYKARIYSPTLGRFFQTDPVGYQDQFNLYAYVGNDPVDYADPSGKDALWVGNPDGSTTLIIPVHYTGADATPANIAAIVNRANSLNISNPNYHVQVVATSTPINGVLNSMDLRPGNDTVLCGSLGECVNRIGGNRGHINSSNPQATDAGAHDTLHFAGIRDRYIEGPRDPQGNRTSVPSPGYTDSNFMTSRSGRELRPQQFEEARSNPSTRQCRLEIQSRIPVCH